MHTSRILQKGAQIPRPAAKATPKSATPTTTTTTTTAPKPAHAKASLPAIGSATAAHALRTSSYAEQLAQKGRTLLYEAPSHFWFRAGCFCSAAFCVSYTVYQYWTVILHPPEGLLWWVPHAFSVILIFMAGMGAYFVLGAGRIVRSIEAVPAKLIAAKAAGAAAPQSPIFIEVATRRAVPFLPAKKILLRPEEVLLPMRMYTLYAGSNGAEAAQKSMSLAERVRAERAAREAKIAAKKYQMDHILTAPFRDAAKAFGTAWAGIRRSFSREGFAKIYLANREYKLDVSGGWALDEGRAMDRLLPVRPNTVRAR
jgi:hypothetical protein